MRFINMGIDINMLRAEKGGNPDLVRESERRRYRKEDQNYVDQAIDLDEKWRKKQFEFEQSAREINRIQKAVGELKKGGKDATAEIAELEALKTKRNATEKEADELVLLRDKMLNKIGNIVHESVLTHDDEEYNPVVRKWGEIPDIKVDSTPGRCAHHQVLAMIDGYDPKRGQKISGHRGYFLKGMGALLNMALVNYGMHFLNKKEYTVLQTPFFMKKSIMAETCQLSDFDDQLYKVSTGKEEEDNEFYLIATSEQPISAYFYKESIEAKELPMRFCGYSSCFRKEAGAHGRDNLGIFRIHQFEKIEQFTITEAEDSWKEHERMISISEEFYKSLKLPYRVINIVSGALNDAAAKKYDLEAWFPSYNAFRELVSCSNCTDFQSRGLEIKTFGAKKEEEGCEAKECDNCEKKEETCEKKAETCEKQEEKASKDKKEKKEGKKEDVRLVHMLNGTLCATERTLCCILENYQTETGVRVPEVLIPYVGTDFIPYVKPVPEIEKKDEKKKDEKKKEETK